MKNNNLRSPFEKDPVVELEPAVWPHDIPGSSLQITTRILANAEPDRVDAYDLIVAPGYGEGEWASRRALQCLDVLGIKAVSPLISVDEIPAEEADIESFVDNAIPQIANDLFMNGHIGGGVTAIGHSLGGAYVSRGAKTEPNLIGNIGLQEPVGLNGSALATLHPDEVERYHNYVARFARVLAGPYLTSPISLARAGKELYSQIAFDLLDRPLGHRFNTKLGMASRLDTAGDAICHARLGNKVFILVGNRDPLIVPAEVSSSIARYHSDEKEVDIEERLSDHNNLEVRVTNQKHSHLGMKGYGWRHLRITAQALGLVKPGIIDPSVHYKKVSTQLVP